MPKDKNLIRIGDKVKVINPDIVDRCGYPLTRQIVKDTMITKEQKDAIITMMRAFSGGTPIPIVEELPQDLFYVQQDDVPPDVDFDTYDKILDSFVFQILKDKNFGGRERILHITHRESLRDKAGWVSERKVVKTGTYKGGGGSYSYDGDFDYEPPYLDNEETHVLFKFRPDYNYNDVCQDIKFWGAWIEKKDLEKII